MESGTFSNVRKIGNYIIKVSKDDNLAKQIMEEMHSRNIYTYVRDINDVGIKTGNLYGYASIFDYNIIIQEFINGMTIQNYLGDNASIKNKLKVFRNFLLIYKKSKDNDNLCLDWNLKNFILSKDDIYYIDFIPCLYKDKIITSNSDNLYQYKESYLNSNIQVAGILGYATMPFINSLPKYDANAAYSEMKDMIDESTGICINDNLINNINHVYFYKISQIENYLKGNIEHNELLNNINSYSMTKILRKEIR